MIARTLLIAGLVAVSFTSLTQQEASAGDPYAMTQVWSHNFAMDRAWHGGYQQQQYGQPLALVVPPTAHMRQTYSWGVSQNTNHAIHHQFGRSANFPGAAAAGTFRHTPNWPSHTDQFGMYYVRGPW
ncbi:hypothetical protein LF1_44820 [Rubripirellula obstinata]|uniref:Uncharacterized protein n=1 Tax=Rubripirellula obstinata TaxID=406547 RepID=A0A5B1CNU6_9BACT|nr:hypothetical protein [Rubripirellula obstinata]KAA1261921.1 hypothetical protein LF1_44820 [Rubripirellula obstinata]